MAAPNRTLHRDQLEVRIFVSRVAAGAAGAELVQMFEGFGRHAAFRKALSVSWEETKNSNMVFLGSFGAAVRAFPQPEKFAIRTLPSAPVGEFRTRISNLQPAPGEPAYFAASPAPCCLVTTEDHALLVFSQGLSPNRVTLLLAGITTIGTQAALEFMCRPSGVRALLSHLPAATKGQLPYFEAVIKVRISGGAPVQSEIVAVHLRRSGP